MGYTVEEIKNLKNPYKTLGTGDALAEHRDELNLLTFDEMKALASHMVLECPQDELKYFGHAIEAARRPQDDEKSFHSVLQQAYEIKQRLLSLLDIKNKNPHNYILGNEFDDKLFNQFHDLALNVLKDNETTIATRLALTTPNESKNQLIINLTKVFPRSSFATQVGAAFTVRRDIERLLLSDKPETFFSSREFSVDLCLEFSALFTVLLKDHETTVGEALALVQSSKMRSDIGRYLEQLNARAHDHQNPFRLIAAAMSPKDSPKQTHLALEMAPPVAASPRQNASNPNALFNSQEIRQRKSTPQSVAMAEESSNAAAMIPIEENSENQTRCCGLFSSH